MLGTLGSYLRRQVGPRLGSILRELELWAAIVAGFAMGLWGEGLPVAESQVGGVLTVVMAYAALAFGFCIAGLTIALGSGDRTFTSFLANYEPHNRPWPITDFKETAYGKLLFVFSWTALMHWFAIALSLGLLVARGSEAHLLPACASVATRVAVGALTTFITYAAMQFLVTLLTLSQAGNTYIRFLQWEDTNRKAGGPEGPAGP